MNDEVIHFESMIWSVEIIEQSDQSKAEHDQLIMLCASYGPPRSKNQEN